MNLSKLFQMQKALDKRIVKEKGLEGVDLLPQKILALQVELGELANEWRGFKFWSNDQEPRTAKVFICHECGGDGESGECACCLGKGSFERSNYLLEEYVDCLHFILSIGNDLDIKALELHQFLNENLTMNDLKSTLEAFQFCFNWIVNLEYYYNLTVVGGVSYNKCYKRILETFIKLGEMLGFTWEQIEQAYIKKNAVNHERQENGY